MLRQIDTQSTGLLTDCLCKMLKSCSGIHFLLYFSTEMID